MKKIPCIEMEVLDDCSEKVRYSFTDFPIFIERMFIGDYPGCTVPAHFHDDIELVAIIEGEMKYNVNGEVLPLSEGEGIIVNSRQMHFDFGREDVKCDFICIRLNPMLLCSITAYERDFILPVIKRGAAYLKLSDSIPWQSKILYIIKRIYANRNSKTAPLKAQSAFAEILALIFENSPPTESGKQPPDGDLMIIKNMVSFIQRHYTEKISLAEIAKSGAVGQSKCCNLFKKYLAQTPNEYLTHYRLNKSMELLLNTDLPITQIAVAVGFGGSSYYAETFHKHYGKSPTEYRMQNPNKGGSAPYALTEARPFGAPCFLKDL